MKGRQLTVEELMKMIGKKVIVEFKTTKLLPNGIYILKWIENKQTHTFMTEDFRCSFDFDTCLGRDAIYYEYIEEPRIYKTSEMIAMLEVNQELKFLCVGIKNAEYDSISVNDGVVCWNGDAESPLYIVTDQDKDRWQLIEEPKEVSFIEAVKAFHEGKTIKSKLKFEHTYNKNENGNTLIDENENAVSSEEIIYSKWFIL